MGCSACEKARAARIAARQAAGKSTGEWSVTLQNGTREFFDNELAAKAFNAANGGGGMVRRVIS